jgi:hypothetical protein
MLKKTKNVAMKSAQKIDLQLSVVAHNYSPSYAESRDGKIAVSGQLRQKFVIPCFENQAGCVAHAYNPSDSREGNGIMIKGWSWAKHKISSEK